MNWLVCLSQGLPLFHAAFGPGVFGKADPENIAIIALVKLSATGLFLALPGFERRIF